MQAFNDFVEANMLLLTFTYGLAYFSAGLAILLQWRGLSNYRLAHNLWLVGTFFIIHGAAKWGDIFIPIQNTYLSESWITGLMLVQKIAWATSYAFLLQFGVATIAPTLPWIPRVKTFVRWYAPLWSASVILLGIIFLPAGTDASWIRYMLGFPATIMTTAAFLVERRSFAALNSRTTYTNLSMTAGAFGLYAVLGGLMVPEYTLPWLTWLNYENVLNFTGFPIHFWRMLLSVVIAFLVIRTLSVFDLEVRQRLETAEKEKTLLNDRQRIARDLHDGVVQSIYAAGLQLEVAASKSIQAGGGEISLILQRVVNQLNEVISNIRNYIFKLGPALAGGIAFDRYLKDLIYEFTSSGSVTARISVKGKRVELTPEQQQNISFVAQECLSNVVKHASASIVDVKFFYDHDSLLFMVEDDGVGIENSKIAGNQNNGGNGLKNMAARAKTMEAAFSVSDRSDESGTVVALRIPYSQGNNLQ